jgi:membrane protein YdbS with pleckstrin-like domain
MVNKVKKIPSTNNIEFTIKPSQWVNFGWLLVAVFLYMYIVPIVIYLWKYLVVSCWSFEFRERSIIQRKGVFNVTKIELNYFRVKSVMVEEPFLLRLVGLSNVLIISSDPFCPYLKLWAVYDGDDVSTWIREKSIEFRKNENVKEHDLFDLR